MLHLTCDQVRDLTTAWHWPATAPGDLARALTDEHRANLTALYFAGRGDVSQDTRPFSATAAEDMRAWGLTTRTGLTNAGEALYRILASTGQDG